MTRPDLPLFHQLAPAEKLGPFIADQRLFWLEATPARVRECLAPERFRLAREANADSHEQRIQHQMPPGCKWHPIAGRTERELLLTDSKRKRVCLLIEAGTGKTIAMQQIQYLRGCKFPGELTMGLRFAALPTKVDDMGEHLADVLRVNRQLMDQKRAVARTVDRCLRSGKLTLVIDSLDEQRTTEDAAAKAQMLGQFLSRHPDITCYVSGRPYSITCDQHWRSLFEDPNWMFVQIDEFDVQQQIAYIGESKHGALERLEAASIANPRLLEAVRKLEPEELPRIRTEAELHGRVVDQTLEKAFQGRKPALDKEDVVYLLSLVAFQMVVEENFSGISNAKAYKKFIHNCFQRVQASAEAWHYEDAGELREHLNKLGEVNEFLKFAFLDNGDATQIHFRSRTLQAFFAALWVARYSATEDEIHWLRENLFIRADFARLQGKLKDEDEERKRQQDYARQQLRYEFWRMLVELPAENSHSATSRCDHTWTQSMSALFLPASGVVHPVRSTEMIYRSFWGLMEVAGCLPAESHFKDDGFDYLVEQDFQAAVTHLQQAIRGHYETLLTQHDPAPHSAGLVGLLPTQTLRVLEQQLSSHFNGTQRILGSEQTQDTAIGLLCTYLCEFLDVLYGRQSRMGSPEKARVAKEFDQGFRLIPPGTFLMGDKRGYDIEPEHEETLADPYWVHQFPVTNEVYDLYDLHHRTRWDGYEEFSSDPRCPVTWVSWFDAWCCATWLLGMLTLEQQWERACRGPVDFDAPRTLYWSGDEKEDLARVAWYGDNSGERTHPVIGEPDDRPPEPGFRLYHMHGQVWEWQISWYSADPRDGKLPGFRGSSRVLRGGSSNSCYDDCRSECRLDYWPEYTDQDHGLRVARA